MVSIFFTDILVLTGALKTILNQQKSNIQVCQPTQMFIKNSTQLIE